MAESETEPARRYAIVVASLRTRPGVSITTPKKRGLGSKALCVNEKIFAMLSSTEQLVVKLPKPRVATLILAGRGSHFELSHGQPMQEWFVAGPGTEQEWLSLAEEALAFVGSE
jgi:hypothetical protein